SPWLLEQYEQFRHIAPSIGFPESHDTERLVTELVTAGFPEHEIEAHYRQAYALAAAFSTGVMMPMGFEYGWARRLAVVASGEERPVRSRLTIAPLEVRVLRASLQATRSVEIGRWNRAHRPPAPRPEWRPETRILIEDVWPEIDGGRYPAKRVVGDEVAVWAD